MVIPPLRRVPEGASDEVHMRMYRESCAELVRLNPGHFLSPGVRRRWYHWIIGGVEYPSVLLGKPCQVISQRALSPQTKDTPDPER
jgi:hypothetical protein